MEIPGKIWYWILVAKNANWDPPLSLFKMFFIIRTMKGNVVAANAAISVPARAGPDGRFMLNPRKHSPENKDTIVIACSLFKFPALFWITDDQHFSGKNETDVPHYICGADNNLINDITVVV
jgi:hypothetical protein